MNRFRMHLKTLAGTAAVLCILLLGAPRAAHAVVAALVQVANTTASPAVTQDVSKMASQLIELTAPMDSLSNPLAPADLSRIDPTTGQMEGNAFVVPPAQNFVITGVDDFQTKSTVAIALYDNFTNGASFRELWGVTGTSGVLLTSSLRFPGIVVLSGHKLSMTIANSTSSDVNVIRLYGYLTAN